MTKLINPSFRISLTLEEINQVTDILSQVAPRSTAHAKFLTMLTKINIGAATPNNVSKQIVDAVKETVKNQDVLNTKPESIDPETEARMMRELEERLKKEQKANEKASPFIWKTPTANDL